MVCPYCNKEAEFVDNAKIYGRRYGQSYMAYQCKPCDALVGVHENDPNRPLGTMANKELRGWRIKAHAAIDPIWKERGTRRKSVYRWLNETLGREVHIGQADIDACKEIIKAARVLNAELDERDAELTMRLEWGDTDFLND